MHMDADSGSCGVLGLGVVGVWENEIDEKPPIYWGGFS